MPENLSPEKAKGDGKACATIALCVLGIPVLCLAVLLLIHFHRVGTFRERYAALQVGLAEEEVTKVFGQSPDHVHPYKNSRILYFFGPGTCGYAQSVSHWEQAPSGELTEEAVIRARLPHAYGAIQLLIGADGRLKAFTQIDEEVAIHTVDGDVPGANLGVLDDSFFE